MQVAIIMSTYNGEDFIAEQVKSILHQLPPEGKLIIRDDGSIDGTINIIRSIKDERITLQCQNNIGFAKSFLSLMKAVPVECKMIMFSDQDDVWLPHKIIRAWEHIENSGETPTLYCARQNLVDSRLNPLALSSLYPRGPSFENALTENIVTGCTAAFNRAALVLALQIKNPDRIYFHDWWLYLVVSTFGNTVFDPDPTILYRQHGKNTLGRGTGVSQYISMMRFMRKRSWVHIMYNQINELTNTYEKKIPEQCQEIIKNYFDTESRISTFKLLTSPRRFRQTIVSDILLRLLIASEIAMMRGLTPKITKL